MPSIRYAHLCEYARIDSSGTVSIIGIFDTIHVPQVPAGFPLLHVITNIGGQKEEAFQFATRIAGPDGAILQAVQPVDIHIHAEGAYSTQINGYMGTVFPAFGEYTVEIQVNGMVVHSIPFKVLQRPGGIP